MDNTTILGIISSELWICEMKTDFLAYHHLDISATLTPRNNKDRNWKGEWVFSIYNLYNRKNAASINFRQNVDTGI